MSDEQDERFYQNLKEI